MEGPTPLRIILCLYFVTLALPSSASPFVPIEWQRRIVSGPLVGQRKHVNWIYDLNGDFVDDRFDLLPPEDVTVILQLSECRDPEELQIRFAPFGNVRHTGVVLAYVILDDVDINLLPTLAQDPIVAAVEMPVEGTNAVDVSTRSVRARMSNTYSPNTVADAFGATGAGVNIAIFDSGVDDHLHDAFGGAFVAGYDADTASPGNPPDTNTFLRTGADGICDTTVGGGTDDVQTVPLGQGRPDQTCIQAGPDGVLQTAPAMNDDVIDNSGTMPRIHTGPDGICDTLGKGTSDDVQVVPLGQGRPGQICIAPGTNAVIDTAPLGDDTVNSNYHGTHVAGIALGRAVSGASCSPADDGSTPDNCSGMAPGAGLVDVHVLSATSGLWNGARLLDAIDWVFKSGQVDVINMSLGGGGNSDGTSTISKAVNALVANDIAVCVAAGNSGTNSLSPMAAAELAITVGNSRDMNTVDRDDDDMNGSSSFGPRIDFNPSNPTVGMLKPDVSAPGTSIRAANGKTASGYTTKSGTSMASPHVAGAVALLLDVRSDAPVGAIKDLLNQTAYVTPDHSTLGASFPAIDGVYNVNWGHGLLDAYAAAEQLNAGVTDMAFTACVGPHPDYPAARPCSLGGNRKTYENDTDIQLAKDPPTEGEPNTVTVTVENRGTVAAQNVVVCLGVKDFGVGVQEFYDVGCQSIPLVGPDGDPADTVTLSFPWTPASDNHQCLQASIDYGFDTDFTNNTTQRNIFQVNSASPSQASFRVENPLNEPATILLRVEADAASRAMFGFEIMERRYMLRPEDCARLNEIQFFPNGDLGVGRMAKFVVAGTATSESHPDGLDLSGAVFKITVVDPGLDRVYTCAPHLSAGEVNLRLALDAAAATTDPRRQVRKIKAVFNVPVRAVAGVPLEGLIEIVSVSGKRAPPFKASFRDAGGRSAGQELVVEFSEPLPDDRYSVRLGDGFTDVDGDGLTGIVEFDLGVLQGDVDGDGKVTDRDVGLVARSINQPVQFGETSRADVNLTGAVTATDISFVRARIGNRVP